MPSYTDVLNLKKTNMTTDGDDFFDFGDDLDQNWDKIDEAITDIRESSLNTDADNLSNTGKNSISALSMPSERYVDLTLGASGSVYTAPANGYYCLSKRTNTNTPVFVCIHNTSCQLRSQTAVNGVSSYSLEVFMPAKKGDTIMVAYNATGETSAFKFIYAEGAE